MSGRRQWPNRDPIEERGGINNYCFVQNRPTGRVDLFGLKDNVNAPPNVTISGPLTVGPPYNPNYWNDPLTCQNNNCANYALDLPFTPNQPPGFDGTCASLTAFARSAGKGKDPDSCGNCPSGTHKVRLWVAPPTKDRDFHFYRQDGDMTWSEKRGFIKPIQPVTDPNTYKDYISCGDLCVDNTSMAH